MKKRKIKYREFLNTRNGMAAVEARCYVPPPYHEYDGHYPHGVDASLSISSCSNTISLDFDVHGNNEKDFKKRFEKIDRLRKALDIVEEALIEGYIHKVTDAEWKQVYKNRKAEQQDEQVDNSLD